MADSHVPAVAPGAGEPGAGELGAEVPVTATATFCATLVDEWIRAGITDAVVAPGSRSTPLALALATRPELRLHVFHDERSASFAALGLGRATGRPAVLLCTSGTAAAEFHAAVVEAHQAGVPMVVCTADRPPELRDRGAAQTIDQTRLFGPTVRWYADPGVPEMAVAGTWRALGARLVADAVGPTPGPVHLNCPFRDPLVGRPGPLPVGRAGGAPWVRSLCNAGVPSGRDLAELVAALDRPRGVIVAGLGAGLPDAVHDLAVAAGWPVLADPRSGCRLPRHSTVAHADGLLRHGRFAADHRPEVVLRLGAPHASKVLNQWLAGSGALQVQVTADASWIDPDHTAAWRVVADPTEFCRTLTGQLAGGTRTPWATRWRSADRLAADVLAGRLDEVGPLSEPGVARRLAAALPQGSALVVSSSMPIRDLEWFAASRDGLRVHANRGANGIDGVVSSAVGVALAGAPTALLIGDVALLHDANGLLGLADRDVSLTVVVVDNDGGGIFHFLPQHGALPTERFEQLYGTPHGIDAVALATVHGIEAVPVGSAVEFDDHLRRAGDRGVRLLHVRTDRRANVAVHAALNDAIAAALDRR
ncbi:MAG: 2-succinyl-5-enolpyruvyl-6-hydroxy-3-cyclohexene-1-carboxylic-acid synthase [Acidimicrobiales bacterium]